MALAGGAAAAPPDLASIEAQSNVRLTTVGRTSGKARTVTIWFVRDGERVYVQAGREGKTDWYRNLLKHPEVILDFDSLRLRGRARPIDDPAETQRVHQRFRDKYWVSSRVSAFLGRGFGTGKVVVVEELAAVERGEDAASTIPK